MEVSGPANLAPPPPTTTSTTSSSSSTFTHTSDRERIPERILNSTRRFRRDTTMGGFTNLSPTIFTTRQPEQLSGYNMMNTSNLPSGRHHPVLRRYPSSANYYNIPTSRDRRYSAGFWRRPRPLNQRLHHNFFINIINDKYILLTPFLFHVDQ